MTIREETDFVVSADGVRAPQNSPVEEIFSEVAAVRELAPGRVEVTLVNGHVWRQTHTDRYRLRVGHKVRIYPAGFGGVYFRLTAPTLRGFVQVERVR